MHIELDTIWLPAFLLYVRAPHTVQTTFTEKKWHRFCCDQPTIRCDDAEHIIFVKFALEKHMWANENAAAKQPKSIQNGINNIILFLRRSNCVCVCGKELLPDERTKQIKYFARML